MNEARSILNEVQRSAAAHEHHARALCTLWRKGGDTFAAEFEALVQQSLTIAKARVWHCTLPRARTRL